MKIRTSLDGDHSDRALFTVRFEGRKAQGEVEIDVDDYMGKLTIVRASGIVLDAELVSRAVRAEREYLLGVVRENLLVDPDAGAALETILSNRIKSDPLAGQE
jgi:hypothetical protein